MRYIELGRYRYPYPEHIYDRTTSMSDNTCIQTMSYLNNVINKVVYYYHVIVGN